MNKPSSAKTKSNKTLCLFDFDGTISHKDSLADFLVFAFGWSGFIKGLLLNSLTLLLYLLKIISNDAAKQKFIYSFFKNDSFDAFEILAERYAEQALHKIVRPQALEKIKWHQAQGHDIYLVSASMENYLKPWGKKLNITVLGTQVKSNNGHFPKTFASANCYGAEKVKRIQQALKLTDYTYIYAYGDSRGDTEMLALANEAIYKPFQN